MAGRLSKTALALVLGGSIVSGCGWVAGQPTAAPPVVGMANPASVFCVEGGYTLEIRESPDGGQYGVCIFDDGTECEEWAYFRGECEPGAEAAPPVEEAVAPQPVEPPSAEPDPDAVDGWVGTIGRYPPGSQLSGYFERDDGQRYGISGIDDIGQQIEAFRWTGAQVAVWGRLQTGVPDVENRQIQVERIEALSGPATESRNLSPFATTSASSSLASDRWGTYQPFSAIDGQLSTPWTEGAAGPGIGEWIMLTFPGTVEVHAIGVDVGYDRDENDTLRDPAIFAANNRLKRATVAFSSGEEVQLEFADQRGVQVIPLARSGAPIETTFVTVVIDEVYAGDTYDDTCLAEVEVWGSVP